MDEELMNKFSDILKEKNIDLNTVLKDFNSNSTTSSNNNEKSTQESEKKTDNNFSDFDINTLLKMKKIFDSTNNSGNNDSNLLLALKPYLRDSRKEKVDQYAKILKLAKAFQTFQNLGGDK